MRQISLDQKALRVFKLGTPRMRSGAISLSCLGFCSTSPFASRTIKMWPRLTAFRRRHVPCDFSRRRSAVLPGTVCGLRQFLFSREPFSVNRTGWWGCNAVSCCSGVPVPVTAILTEVHRGLYHWLPVHAGAALWNRLLSLSNTCLSLSTPSLHVSIPGWIYASEGIPRGEKESPFIHLILHF
jgi:hypothetical protein